MKTLVVAAVVCVVGCGAPVSQQDAGAAGGSASTAGGNAVGGGSIAGGASGGGAAGGINGGGSAGGSAAGGSSGGMSAGGSSAGGSSAGGSSAGGSAGGAVSTSRELFVATTGNDMNPGTMAQPLRTIAKAVMVAGSTTSTTISLRAGTWTEKVHFTGNSSPTAALVVLRSFPGEQAIIDGTGLTASGQEGLVDIANRSNVRIEGLEVRNFRTSNSNVPVGIQLTGGMTNVTLSGNHVHDIVTTIETCSGNNGNALGIAVYGNDAATSISNLTLVGNEVDNLKTGCSESLTLNGNVDGFLVENNRVHDNDNIGIDIIGFEGTATGAADQARNGVVRLNQVWNITSLNNPAYMGQQAADGIYVDGGKNVLIERNVVHNADLGIEIASEHSGKSSSYVLVRDNLVYYSPQAGVSVGGYSNAVGNTDHTIIINNTLYENEVELQLQFHITTTVYQNNVVHNLGGNYRGGTSSGVTFTTNLERTGSAATTFVTPGTPRNGAIAVDLHTVASLAGSIVNRGTALLTCPAGWTCPSVWGADLQGAVDFAGNPRANGVIDLGAYEN